MVLAVLNALGLPVIIFSSAHHYPLIYITPRDCKVPVPLFIAFNQANAGHYDAVTCSDMSNTSSEASQSSASKINENRCTCGQKGKHYSTEYRCISIQKKYTSVIYCPCLASNRSCTSECICNNCNNPKGTRQTISLPPRKRRRQKHYGNKHSRKTLCLHLNCKKIWI